MRTHEVPNIDGPRRWFLDSPEAEVLSREDERTLLLELADCKGRLREATRRPDGSEWGSSTGHVRLQQAVRDLASADPATDPRLAELRTLARRYEEIRTALALANSRLVAHLAQGYGRQGIPLSDLIQEGFCGLLMGIDRFDTANTTRLSTYAVWWIRQAMQRAIAGGAHPVRLNPKQLRRLMGAIAQSPEIPADRPADLPPSDGNWSGSTRQELAAIRPRTSLDAPCRNDGSTPLSDLLASAPEPDPDRSETLEFLGNMLRILQPRERVVLELRFGLDGEPRRSLRQVSKVLEVSKERVRQIQERALEKLRIATNERDVFESSPTRPSVKGPTGHSSA